MIPIFKPTNPVEQNLAESLLEENGIPYYVQNAAFGSLFPGLPIDAFNAPTLMIPDDYEKLARRVLEGVKGEG